MNSKEKAPGQNIKSSISVKDFLEELKSEAAKSRQEKRQEWLKKAFSANSIKNE